MISVRCTHMSQQPASSSLTKSTEPEADNDKKTSAMATATSCPLLNCHGYSHTLQYFPTCDLLPEEKFSHQNHSDTAPNMNFPYIQDFESNNDGCHKTTDQHQSTPDADGGRKKASQQKRSWTTENYQWMNIKRTGKSQQLEGNNNSFSLKIEQTIHSCVVIRRLDIISHSYFLELELT